MSFFVQSNGQAVQSTGNFESGGGLAPIPDGTQVLAVIDEAKWDAYQNESYISLRWSVAKPQEYVNRKIFQKIKVQDSDLNKRDKALLMLAAIDTNAGGKLQAAGVQPDTQALAAALMNRPMVLKLGVWELDDKSKSGNWVSKVAPRPAAGQAAPAAPAPAPKPQPKPAPAPMDDDFDVPF
jgi:hypothetical protein